MWIGAAVYEGFDRGGTAVAYRSVERSDPALIGSVRVGAGPNEPGNDHGLLVGIPRRRTRSAVNGIVKRFCAKPVPRANVGSSGDQLLCNARLVCRRCQMKGCIARVEVVLDPVEKVFLRRLPGRTTGGPFFCQVRRSFQQPDGCLAVTGDNDVQECPKRLSLSEGRLQL